MSTRREPVPGSLISTVYAIDRDLPVVSATPASPAGAEQLTLFGTWRGFDQALHLVVLR
jgi:hypothetical protein